MVIGADNGGVSRADEKRQRGHCRQCRGCCGGEWAAEMGFADLVASMCIISRRYPVIAATAIAQIDWLAQQRLQLARVANHQPAARAIGLLLRPAGHETTRN